MTRQVLAFAADGGLLALSQRQAIGL